MNKPVIFGVLGFVFGAAGGSAVTYYLVNEKRDEELEAYAEHCDERIKRIKEKFSESHSFNKDIKESEEEHHTNPEEDKINQNKGVKKYHHSDGISSKYGENHIFESKKEKINQKLISEIEEEDFLNEDNGYKKEIIDILLGDDLDIVGFWGYGTDNETFVEKRFDMGLEDLIGKEYVDYDYLLNISDEEDNIGTIHIRNNGIMTDFEIIVHDLREEDKK